VLFFSCFFKTFNTHISCLIFAGQLSSEQNLGGKKYVNAGIEENNAKESNTKEE
jgi:hypothetical protein